MEVQRLSLPTRIVDSAKSLGSSTFSGISGLESALKDLRASKQLQATSESYTGKPDHNIEDVRLVGREQNPAEAGFRTQPTRSEIAVAQRDFDEFCHLMPASIESWATPENDEPCKGVIDFSIFSEGSCAFSEGWTTPRLRPAVIPIEVEADEVASLGDWNAPSEATDRVELLDTAVRSTAVRRLEQLDGHLLRVSAQQDIQQRDGDALQDMTKPLEDVQLRLQRPLSQQGSRQRDSANINESTYHCPHTACQHKSAELQRLRQVSCMPRPRCCVHARCAFRTSASKEWSKHVQKPHHGT